MRSNRVTLAVSGIALAGLLFARQPPRPLKVFVQKNCLGCHNSGFPSAGVDLERMVSTADSFRTQRTTWEMVSRVVDAKRMPPPGAPAPAAANAKAFVDTVNAELEKAK